MPHPSFAELPTFFSHLECGMTGEHHAADRLHGLSRAGKPLLVRYDLEALGRAVAKEAVARRPEGLWHYREFLPTRPIAKRWPMAGSARTSASCCSTAAPG
jgi:threonine synthase